MNALPRNLIAAGIGAFALLILLISSVVTAKETLQGVIVRFGEPIAIINPYRADQNFGRAGAGLVMRMPFIDQIVWIDKRVLDIEMDRQQVLSTDQLRLNVNAYARFRIVDPLKMYKAAGTVERVSDQLRPILGSQLRNELGKVTFASLLTPERSQVMDSIQRGLNNVAKQYGAEIIDVRIKRADLPEGTPLDSAYLRMRTARQQEALTIRANGARDAQIIRAKADAAAARTYANAFNKDPKFYDFYRAMKSYEHTFGTDGTAAEGRSSIILSPQNDYLREFRGRP